MDEPRLDHVLVVGVGPEGAHEGLDLGGLKLAVLTRKLQHLVASCLDGAGLVHAHVPARGRDHALPGLEQAGDHDLVGQGPPSRNWISAPGRSHAWRILRLADCEIGSKP